MSSHSRSDRPAEGLGTSALILLFWAADHCDGQGRLPGTITTIWSLRGVGLREGALPMILGCDAAGLDEDGNEVVVHAVVNDPSWMGDQHWTPGAPSSASCHQGTFADQVIAGKANVIASPPP
ncbi:MAG: hypothetical protein R2709_11755 [Marmoricola sp.]